MKSHNVPNGDTPGRDGRDGETRGARVTGRNTQEMSLGNIPATKQSQVCSSFSVGIATGSPKPKQRVGGDGNVARFDEVDGWYRGRGGKVGGGRKVSF